MSLPHYGGPRVYAPSVWCARWLSPACRGGADAEGFAGGGEPEMCTGCEADRLSALLARAGETVSPPLETARECADR